MLRCSRLGRSSHRGALHLQPSSRGSLLPGQTGWGTGVGCPLRQVSREAETIKARPSPSGHFSPTATVTHFETENRQNIWLKENTAGRRPGRVGEQSPPCLPVGCTADVGRCGPRQHLGQTRQAAYHWWGGLRLWSCDVRRVPAPGGRAQAPGASGDWTPWAPSLTNCLLNDLVSGRVPTAREHTMEQAVATHCAKPGHAGILPAKPAILM